MFQRQASRRTNWSTKWWHFGHFNLGVSTTAPGPGRLGHFGHIDLGVSTHQLLSADYGILATSIQVFQQSHSEANKRFYTVAFWPHQFR
jgi:hypothetical protein